MGSRRKSRELVLQVLFHMDIQKRFEADMFERFCQVFPPSEKIEAFFCDLLNGILEARAGIDALIEQHSSNWKMSRMAAVDRNLLRMGADLPGAEREDEGAAGRGARGDDFPRHFLCSARGPDTKPAFSMGGRRGCADRSAAVRAFLRPSGKRAAGKTHTGRKRYRETDTG